MIPTYIAQSSGGLTWSTLWDICPGGNNIGSMTQCTTFFHLCEAFNNVNQSGYSNSLSLLEWDHNMLYKQEKAPLSAWLLTEWTSKTFVVFHSQVFLIWGRCPCKKMTQWAVSGIYIVKLRGPSIALLLPSVVVCLEKASWSRGGLSSWQRFLDWQAECVWPWGVCFEWEYRL